MAATNAIKLIKRLATDPSFRVALGGSDVGAKRDALARHGFDKVAAADLRAMAQSSSTGNNVMQAEHSAADSAAYSSAGISTAAVSSAGISTAAVSSAGISTAANSSAGISTAAVSRAAI